HFIYCIAEFLAMLSHDTLHSKQFIKALRLFTVIVNSVQIEDDKWERLSRQIVDLLLAHLQSQLQVINFFCEGKHLDESGLLLVLLIEQFLPLPLYKQLLPKYLPLIL
ncbi:unnamed protein product, partial [Rotaria sp. Silwood1]